MTGAGGGLGRDIALGLAAKGYLVFGSAMSAAEVQDLKDASNGRVNLMVCDITKEQAVKAWAGCVSDVLGDRGLDLLINNAGILTPGPLEILPLDTIRQEFEVNVFGALSVMNAFLPALRKARVCYDHLAGELGVLVFAGLVRRKFLRAEPGELVLTEAGRAFFRKLGIDLDALPSGRRPLCLACLDWSVRRHHLAGSLGAGFLSRCLTLRWARRAKESRVVHFSALGETALRERFAM